VRPRGRPAVRGRATIALLFVAFACAVAVACSKSTRSAGTVEPIPIPHFLPDAAPAEDAGPTPEQLANACGPNCAAESCDDGVCLRCLVTMDDREHPDGRVVFRRTGIPIRCEHMPATSAVEVTASGDVSTEDRCTNWHAGLRIESRKHGQVGRLQIDALGEQVYPVHLEGVTATDATGTLELVLAVGDVSSNLPGRCQALRFHPHFTVTVTPR